MLRPISSCFIQNWKKVLTKTIWIYSNTLLRINGSLFNDNIFLLIKKHWCIFYRTDNPHGMEITLISFCSVALKAECTSQWLNEGDTEWQTKLNKAQVIVILDLLIKISQTNGWSHCRLPLAQHVKTLLLLSHRGFKLSFPQNHKGFFKQLLQLKAVLSENTQSKPQEHASIFHKGRCENVRVRFCTNKLKLFPETTWLWFFKPSNS